MTDELVLPFVLAARGALPYWRAGDGRVSGDWLGKVRQRAAMGRDARGRRPLCEAQPLGRVGRKKNCFLFKPGKKGDEDAEYLAALAAPSPGKAHDGR